MYCTNCGNQSNVSDDKFCSACGNKFGNSKKQKSPSTGSNIWWGLVGAWVGGITFAALFYLFEDLVNQYEFLPLVAWLVCIVYGVIYFRNGNKKVKQIDLANPESRMSLSMKFLWTLIGFSITGFIAWVSMRYIFQVIDSELLPMDYSVIYLIGMSGAVSLWEYKVLKEDNLFFEAIGNKIKKSFD
jgi:hypothetical protein